MNSPIKTVKRRSTCLRKQGRKKKRKVSFLTKQVVVRDQPFDFWLVGGRPGFFPQDFLFIFFNIFSQSESQNIFFRTKQKNKIFFLNSIYAQNVFFYIYTFVYFLNPIYMGILFICSCRSWILGPSVYVHVETFFLISAIYGTFYPVDTLHFT